MSTPVITPTEEPVLDPQAFLKERNAQEQAKREGKEAPAAPAKPRTEEEIEADIEKEFQKAANDKGNHTIPARTRRELNRLREELGEVRGKLAAYEEIKGKPAEVSRETEPEAEKPKVDDDPKPKREAFASESEYLEAVAAHAGRAEAKKQLAENEKKSATERENNEMRQRWAENDKKAAADAKAIPDYDAVMKKAAADPDAPTFKVEEHPTLMGLFLDSDVKALMYYHLAKEPDEMRRLLELSPKGDPKSQKYIDDSVEQITEFKGLERFVKRLYSTKQKQEVVQASAEPKGEAKERTTHPAEVAEATGRKKPRPSSEVEATGGSPPPEEPAVGSKAWMEKRNAQTGGR